MKSGYAFTTRKLAAKWAHDLRRGKAKMKNLSINCPAGYVLTTKIDTSTTPSHPFTVNVFCKKRKKNSSLQRALRRARKPS